MAEHKKGTTFALSSKTLARLLKLGAQAAEAQVAFDDDQLKAELLHDRLAETLPICEMQAEGISRRQTRMFNTIGTLSGESIGALLLTPGSDIDVLRRIKDLGRRWSETAASEPEHHVANTIYFAAIAGALVHTGAKITTHSFASLTKSFSALREERWVPEPLAHLFVKATRICQDRCT